MSDINEDQRMADELQSLWRYSKIVTREENGHLSFNEGNFNEIMKSVSPETLKLPVNLVAIIGPRGSGKSFYTNLLIQYLKYNGTGGWLTKLLEKRGEQSDILKGFEYGNMTCSPNLKPDEDSSGIYLYPEPFLGNQDMLKPFVLVLHLHNVMPDNNLGNPEALDALLNLVCSKIIEIIWKSNEIRLYETRQLFEAAEEVEQSLQKSLFCKNIVFLHRTLEPTITCTDNKNEAFKLLKNIQPNLKDMTEVDSLIVAHLPELTESLYNESGQLTVTTNMCRTIRTIFTAITVEEDIGLQDTNGETLLLSGMAKYLESGVERINKMHMAMQKDMGIGNQFSPNNPKGDSDGNSTFGMPNEDFSENNANGKSMKGQLDDVDDVSINACSLPEQGANSSGTALTEDLPKVALRRGKMSPSEYDLLITNIDDETTESHGSRNSKQCNASTAVQQSYPDGPEDTKPQEAEINGVIKSPVETEDPAESRLIEEFATAEKKEVRKKEKKIKAEEENAREETLLTEILNYAKTEIKKKMVFELNDWINTKLNIATVNSCKGIYNKCFEKIVQEVKISRELKVTFQEQLTEETSSEQKSYSDIHRRVKKFHSVLNQNFERSLCFENSKLEEIISNQIQIMLKGLGDQSQPFVRTACRHLGEIYVGHNQRIVKLELGLATLSHKKITQEYKIYLDMIMRRGPFQLKYLENVHQLLANKYKSAIKISPVVIPRKENCGANFETAMSLTEDLNTAFKYYKLENLNMLAAVHKQLIRSICIYKRQYDETMDTCLRENPQGVDKGKLQKLHEDTQANAKASLEKELKTKNLEQLSQITTHVITLQTHINEAWADFKEDNDEKLALNGKFDDDFEEKKRMQMEKLKQERTQSKISVKRDAALSKQLEQSGNTNNPVINPDSTRYTGGGISKTKSLSPLIFQLTLSKVITGVALNKTASKCRPFQTPALVGVTKSGHWFFGAEVNKQGEADILWFWNIGECLTNNRNEKWSQEIKFLGESHIITIEFLLGSLLNFLKEKVENEENGVVSTAIIIVPFWTASSQRKWIKDAGKIAGFKSTFLMSENSAIAYGMAKLRKTNAPYTNCIVLSENSDRVDVSVYCYKPYSGGELQMNGHCGTYSIYIQQSSVENNAEETIMKALDNAMTECGKRYEHCKTTEVFITYESEKWKDALKSVAQQIHSSWMEVQEFQIALHGALWFCQNPVQIRAQIKDKISHDVLRNCSDGGQKLVQRKQEVSLTTEPLPIYASLKRLQKEVRFYQSTANGEIDIGQLKMLQIPSAFQVDCLLFVNYEGIVSLKFVEVEKFWNAKLGWISRGTYQAHLKDYNWSTPILSDTEVANFSYLVEALFKERVANVEQLQAKQCLSQRAEDIMRRIKNNEGSFRSDVGRDMILDQIKDIIELASHPSFSDVENKNSVLDEISRKYLPNTQ